MGRRVSWYFGGVVLSLGGGIAACRVTSDPFGTVTPMQPPTTPQGPLVVPDPPTIVTPPSGATCGGDGQPCCADFMCAEHFACDQGTCRPCGTTGQLCCDDRRDPECPAGHICFGADGAPATCQRCGGVGEPCCADASCSGAWSACDRDSNPPRCRACGGTGELCCGGANREEQCQQPDGGMIALASECNEVMGTLRCGPCGTGGGTAARCRPPVTGCGADGQRCCVSGLPCGRGLVCRVGTCGRCGSLGTACCPGRTPCPPGLQCNGAGLCTLGCGRLNQPCCGTFCVAGRCLGGVCRR